MKRIPTIIILTLLLTVYSCKDENKTNKTMQETTDTWEIDFLDNFDTFNTDNWQDQRIWVNNEKQCYVPDGEFGTREVSNGK